jgi:tRNA(adenine34) deaminase
MMPLRDDGDLVYMRRAMELAARAAQEGEVPVGAILVKEGETLGESWNRPVSSHDPSAHAEVLALREGGARLQNYRLTGCTLYVTLEPCAMCVGAIVHARIGRLVFGAYDRKAGAAGSMFDLLQDTRHNHIVQVVGGVLEEDSLMLLQSFFSKRRGARC